MLISYSIGLIALIIVALVRAEPLPAPADLGWGALAGLLGMLGLSFLLRGYATGRFGIVAPVSGVLAAGISVLFNALTEGLPANKLQIVGFGIALVGIWLLSRPESVGGRPAGLGMGFGGYFIALDQVVGTAVFWPSVAGRVATCSALGAFALATHRPLQLHQSPLRLLTLAGLFDVAGNVFFLLAVQNGRLDISAVLASLYPAVTAILAWLTIKEHLTGLQVIGVCAAVVAIVLITM